MSHVGTVLTGFACLLATRAAVAQLTVDWYTIDGGGTTFTAGGGFELGATLGQPDAGQVLTGGGFELVGGFWAVSLAAPPRCVGDLDGDGVVALSDLSRLLSNFGTSAGAASEDGDSDGDGDIDLTDLTTLLSVFGTVCP
ncbi:MAG: hypothetical protein IT450_09605 [Phycisphaerales bacterium]|nr:hypothetical protein [Phycisphaerales bacterium]